MIAAADDAEDGAAAFGLASFLLKRIRIGLFEVTRGNVRTHAVVACKDEMFDFV